MAKRGYSAPPRMGGIGRPRTVGLKKGSVGKVRSVATRQAKSRRQPFRNPVEPRK